MKRVCKWRILSVCFGLVLFLLTSCTSYRGAVYEIIYSSGYIRDPYVRTDTNPVEGTAYQIRGQKSADYEETHQFDLQVLNESYEVLYEYPQMGSNIVRSEAGDRDNTIWVCSETWSAPHYNGYIDGCLDKSILLLLDMQNGEILFQTTMEADQFYLTSIGDSCYFYAPGKEAREKLFGLIKAPSENANIYYRNISDWAEKHTIYSFDYVAEPDIDTSNGVETRLKFYISEEQVKVAWTSYESIGNGNWEYLEKKAYEIPLDGNNFK